MKQLTCEMCGSTDMLKQDGVFVCQSCGCKYSVEEAKKMMVEGVVEVTGTVKVDDSARIDNYYTMAESAYQVGNKQETENYCNKIIEIDISYYKAWFLKGKAVGWQSRTRFGETVQCFDKAVDNAPEDIVEDFKADVAAELCSFIIPYLQKDCDQFSKRPTENVAHDIIVVLHMAKLLSVRSLLNKCGVKPAEFYNELVTMVSNDVVTVWEDDILVEYTKSNFPSEYSWKYFIDGGIGCISILTEVVDLSEDGKQAIRIHEKLIEMSVECINSRYRDSNGNWWDLNAERKQELNDLIEKSHQCIKKHDPSYEIPKPSHHTGCYVATAVYGSYDCPQVWTLRRFRDYTLAKTWYGRAFIRTYYAISPTLVKWFGNTEWFKKMWRGTLDRMVANLNADGVEDTPYEDKVW